MPILLHKYINIKNEVVLQINDFYIRIYVLSTK